jgi:hypothetical protein
LSSAPIFVQSCHCRDCQRYTGSAFVINGLIETDRVRLLAGTPEQVRVRTPLGRIRILSRCPECQTVLWNEGEARPWIRLVRMSTLDEPSLAPPQAQIFTRSKIDWVPLEPDIPAFESSYDAAALWPEEAISRRAAAERAWTAAHRAGPGA